jgi:hypothetical protein
MNDLPKLKITIKTSHLEMCHSSFCQVSPEKTEHLIVRIAHWAPPVEGSAERERERGGKRSGREHLFCP